MPIMKLALPTIGGIIFLSACSLTPPPPPAVSGEYRPVNRPDTKSPEHLTPRIFDFKYRGNLQGSLQALTLLQPPLTILPPSGTSQHDILIDVDLRQVSLEKALKKLGENGQDKYEVIFKSDPATQRDFAYIRYLR